MLGLILVGCASGLVATAVALLAGASFKVALLICCLATLAGAILASAAKKPLAEMRARRNPVHNSGKAVGSLTAEPPAELPPPDQSGAISGEAANSLATVGQNPAGLRRTLVPAMRILAVDDDPFIRELVPMISAEVGFRKVTTAASGWEALALLGTGERLYDCLLLDIDMPDMDGIELCRQLREVPAYRDVPVIMLTAMRDMRHMDSAFRAGATDYTTKPFDVIEFGARLHLAQDRIEALADLAPEATSEAGQIGAGRQSTLELQVAGMPNLIEQRSLANYIGQLNRGEANKIAVLAVQMDQIDSIGPDVTTKTRIAALRDVATAVCAVIGVENCQIAYGGHGIFLLAVQTSALSSRDIEAEINQHLSAPQGETSPAAAPHLTISAGEPVLLQGRKQQRAEMAFKRAVLAVNHRKLFDRSELNSLDGLK